jgi:DNA polymerase/3'-5' exonuclease PolX
MGINFPDEPVQMISALSDELIWSIGLPIKNGDRMKQIELPEGIMLDLFIVLPPAQWGVIYAIRTGPADYSHWLVTLRKHGGALPSYMKVHDGGIYEDAELIETPEESDVFKLLQMQYVKPEDRRAPVGFLQK